MANAAGWLGKVLVAVLFVAWQLAVHVNVSGGDTVVLRYLLLALPLAALAWWIARHTRNKALWLAALAAAAAAAFVLEQRSHLGLAAATGLPHATAYVFLLFLFGHTLLPGRVALVTRLARSVHGALPPYMETYTRRLTAAWCVFFAVQLAASAALFTYATLDAWSVFVNVLNLPLLALMFAGEYLYRIARYRDFPHASIAEAVGAFVRDAARRNAGPG